MKNQQDQQIVSSLLIFVIVVMLVFAITGCSTAVPVTAKFPEAPGKNGTKYNGAYSKVSSKTVHGQT